MLNELVTDKNLAWEKDDLSPGDFLAVLSPAAREEIASRRETLRLAPETFGPGSHDLGLFPVLREEMARSRRSHLENGPGILWLRGALTELEETERKNAHWVMMSFLGEPIPQNEQAQLYIQVVDEGQRMSAGGRYHKSNEGGELHTDSPQYEHPPELISLLCVHPAPAGGESKLLSAYAVHNALLRGQPERLPLLYENYHFHRKATSETTLAPVFTYDSRRKSLCCRYLGDYVRSGHAVKGEKLAGTPKGEALAALDATLSQENLVVELNLCDGDVLVLDNQRILHGRSSFHDDPGDGRPRRQMGRLWLRAQQHA
jgi:alpha-ketoglutarate-dependent taurine dioxygenase